jgi:hypothetical protein
MAGSFVLIVSGMLMILAGIGIIRRGRGSRADIPPATSVRRPVLASPQRRLEMGSGQPAQSHEFQHAGLGATVRYRHPERGELAGRISGTIEYAELWQRRRGAQEPWVATGNIFPAHWLGDTLLYSWKGVLWLLDSYDPLSDADIQRHFLPHAQTFARSDQTAEVFFAYPPASWKMTDIGKFEVRRADGQGLRLQPGAFGRFIHAQGNTGNEGRALVVEDYQEGSGGMDTAWLGWKISWDDMIDIG